MKNHYQSAVFVGLMTFALSLPAAQTSSFNNASTSAQQAKISVTTVKISEIKSDRAKCSFTVQGSPINEKGVCFSEKPSPTINSKKSIAPGNPTNSGISILSGLKASTTYYVRAYVKSGSEVLYGNELIFTTTAPQDKPKNANQNTGKKVETKNENKK